MLPLHNVSLSLIMIDIDQTLHIASMISYFSVTSTVDTSLTFAMNVRTVFFTAFMRKLTSFNMCIYIVWSDKSPLTLLFPLSIVTSCEPLILSRFSLEFHPDSAPSLFHYNTVSVRRSSSFFDDSIIMPVAHTLFHLLVILSTSASHRIARRFLNAEVHNRIDVLSQSHERHQQFTTWLRNIIFGSSITLSALFLVTLCGFLYLCVRVRPLFRLTQSSNLFNHLSSPTSTLFNLSPLNYLAPTISNVRDPHMHFSTHPSLPALPAITPSVASSVLSTVARPPEPLKF